MVIFSENMIFMISTPVAWGPLLGFSLQCLNLRGFSVAVAMDESNQLEFFFGGGHPD